MQTRWKQSHSDVRKTQRSHYVQTEEQNKHQDNLQTQCDVSVEKTNDNRCIWWLISRWKKY